MLTKVLILATSLNLAMANLVINADVINEIHSFNYDRLENKVDTKLVQLQLYYEGLCPFCHKFIKDELAPTYAVLGKYLNVSLNPYGNARDEERNGDYVFQCQHGPKECEADLLQACLLNKLQRQRHQVQVLACIVASGNENISSNTRKCLENLGLSKPTWNEVSTCGKGIEGRRLLHHLGQITKALRPEKQWVPWIVIDGKTNTKVQSGLREYLCENQLRHVKECRQAPTGAVRVQRVLNQGQCRDF